METMLKNFLNKAMIKRGFFPAVAADSKLAAIGDTSFVHCANRCQNREQRP